MADILPYKNFLPSCFFSFEEFEHKTLFDQNQPIHLVFEKLKTLNWSTKIASPIPKNVTITNSEQVTIEEGVLLAPYACIEGPCFIGKDCRIGHGAYIRPYTILSRGSVVGHASEVKGSIFFAGAKAPHFCYVGDSILGRRVNLGAGTKCANFRFDKKEVTLHRKGENLITDRIKLGAIIGDFALTGCNVVLQPGTIVEKGEIIRC